MSARAVPDAAARAGRLPGVAARAGPARRRGGVAAAGGRSRLGWLAVLSALVAGCGGATPRSALRLRAELDEQGLTAAAERAPDLVAEVRAVLEAAEASERAGDAIATSDHLARASLLGAAAIAESDRLALEIERRDEERATIAAEDEAVRLDAERAALAGESALLASARAARDELRRALARAEREEGTRRRSARLSLDDARELRAAALAIRDRARLLLAAAAALGAGEAARAEALRLVGDSEAETTDLLRALRLADDAHDAARAALGAARRAAGGPSPEEVRSLAEAADADGFGVVSLERGTGLELGALFAAGSTSLEPAARRRLERAATLLAAHPTGPVHVEVDVSGDLGSAARLARARAEAVRAALVAAGVEASRVSLPDGAALDARAAAPADRVRLVLVAYVGAPSTGAAASAASDASPTSAESTPADPTPRR